jgi:hypothetical protein
MVEVGAYGKTLFNHPLVETAVGDVLEFQFLALNHILTQSPLMQPCEPRGFDTDFTHFNPGNNTDDFLQYLVQNTDPQWFFCRQDTPLSHCNAGMVFAINPSDHWEKFVGNAQQASCQISTSSMDSRAALIKHNVVEYYRTTPSTGSFCYCNMERQFFAVSWVHPNRYTSSIYTILK